MANGYIVSGTDLTAIADAIRTKGETTERLVFPGGFVSAIGDISTGVELNFEIVGGTSQPSSPAANTIWVNTDVPIIGWYFGAEDISGQIDVSNAVNASNVVSGFSNGVISFNGDMSPAWSSTYVAKMRLVEGVKYVLSANVGYGRFSIAKNPDVYPDGVIDFVEQLNCGDILNCRTQSVEITPIETADYYMNYCSDQACENGTKPSFSTGIYLYPKDVNIWIQTGTPSNVAFNALKRNGIFVYPNSAKQYVSGAWAEKEAKIYQDGTWAGWIPAGALYWNGNKRTEITGGWTFGLGRGTGANYPLGKYLDGEDGVTLYLENKANSIQMSTTNKIELGPYNTIFAEAVDNTLPDGNFFLKYGSTHPLSDGIARVSFITNTGDAKRASIDISGVTGSYYIAIEAFTGGTANGSAKVVKVWLE